MARTRLWALGGVALLAALLVLPPAASAQRVSILGGGVVGQPYQFAVALSKILKQHAGIDATVESTGGLVDQARILASRRAEFVWGLGGPLGRQAYEGKGRFQKEGPKKNLRAILAYPFGPFQWLTLAKSGITKLSDASGRRISVGAAASTTQTFSRIFLPRHGVKEGRISTPGFTGGFSALKDGVVDIHLTMGAVPLAAVNEITVLNKIRLVEMDRKVLEAIVKEMGPGLSVVSIPPGAYGKNQVNEGPVLSISQNFGFTTHDGVSADLVYKVLKTLFDHKEEFYASHYSAKTVNRESALQGLVFPLHAGAERYWKEVGLLK